MVCATGTPAPTARWLRNGREVNTELGRVSCESTPDGIFRLVFSEVWSSDDGEYACVASNAIGQATTTCRVRIGCKEPGRPNGVGMRAIGRGIGGLSKPAIGLITTRLDAC